MALLVMMENSNRVVQGLWVEGELSKLEQLSLASFLANGHEYHLYSYGNVSNVPDGVLQRDGREILSDQRIFTVQQGFGKGSHCSFADVFRYHLLHQKGGWWVDTDVVCLRPFDFQDELVVAASKENKLGELANNCVLKLPANSPMTNFLVERVDSVNPEELGFPDLGPFLVQEAVRELGLEHCIAPASAFCPISWREVGAQLAYYESPFSKERVINCLKRWILQFKYPHFRWSRLSKESYALHFWNEIWRSEQLNKNDDFHPSCYFERYKKQYLSTSIS